jgi:glycerol-3-phosphate dehydrogenase subunit C
MCLPYCGSFPDLFRRVDGYVARGKGEVEAFEAEDYKSVNDLCWQCKVCYFKCPYTPDDQHPFMVDFPRLALRHKAQRAARDGVSLQDRVLGEPQALGRAGAGPQAPMANLVSENRLLRKVQEVVTGISAEFNLPPFARVPFRTWWKDHVPDEKAGSVGEVALFATCSVEWNLPAAARAAVQVLEHNGMRVSFAEEQTCCGMPNMDGGDLDAARAKAEKNVAALAPLVARGMPVVVPGPTCSYVLRKEYPEMLRGNPEAAAVAAATMDLMEYLRKRVRDKTLVREWVKPLGRIAYHAPCHLRVQKVGFPAAFVLGKIDGTEVEVIEQCSAVDGTWGMKAQHYEMGRKYAQKLVGEMAGVKDAAAYATDCPLAGLRLEQELGQAPVHPIELVNEAYGLPAVRDDRGSAAR